mgnify:CR=1 FL=1
MSAEEGMGNKEIMIKMPEPRDAKPQHKQVSTHERQDHSDNFLQFNYTREEMLYLKKQHIIEKRLMEKLQKGGNHQVTKMVTACNHLLDDEHED